MKDLHTWWNSPEYLAGLEKFDNRVLQTYGYECLGKEDWFLSAEFRNARAAYRRRINGKTKADH